MLGDRTEQLGTVIRAADFMKRTSDSIIHFVQISRRTAPVINMAFHVPPQILNYVAVGNFAGHSSVLINSRLKNHAWLVMYGQSNLLVRV